MKNMPTEIYKNNKRKLYDGISAFTETTGGKDFLKYIQDNLIYRYLIYEKQVFNKVSEYVNDIMEKLEPEGGYTNRSQLRYIPLSTSERKLLEYMRPDYESRKKRKEQAVAFPDFPAINTPPWEMDYILECVDWDNL